MTSNTIIQSLLSEQEAKLRAEAEEENLKKTEAIEKLRASLREYLGEFWLFLEERFNKTGEPYSYTVENNSYGYPAHLVYLIPAIPEEELAPIRIKWGFNSLQRQYRDYSEKFYVWGITYADLPEALLGARKAYPAYIAELKKKALEEFHKTLWKDGVKSSEEEAQNIVIAFIEKWPDLESKAREDLEDWIERRGQYLKREERERREKEAQEAKEARIRTITLSYIEELSRAVALFDAVSETNRRMAESIQVISDSRPYRVYRLTWALVAEFTEDGETYREIETRYGYTLQEEPEAGYWTINGKPIKFFNSVSLEPMDVQASSGILAKKVEKAGIEIFFAPDTTEEKIDEVMGDILPLPELPPVPEELRGEYPESAWLRAAREWRKTEGRIDIFRELETAKEAEYRSNYW